jgi:hypothetical protein
VYLQVKTAAVEHALDFGAGSNARSAAEVRVPVAMGAHFRASGVGAPDAPTLGAL